MLKYLLLPILLLSFHFSSARSIMTCEPTVVAQPSYLFCRQDNLTYSIEISTLMSHPRCTERKEIHTANIEVSDGENVVDVLEIQHDDFTYELGSVGAGRFDSDIHDLHLDQCVSPIHGGVSIGN